MHLYFFVRGKFEQVELWKAHAQTSYWKWRRINNTTGKEEITIVQGALRPSIFGAYEFIFPKEVLAEVCSFFGINDDETNESNSFNNFGLYTRHFLLRKIFNCKKIPKKILKKAGKIPKSFTTAEFERASSNCIIPGVEIHVIGIKKDVMTICGNYTQEAL